jgi:hypothetical protein
LICGRSIGTGPAIKLTSLFRFAGVILVTPFMSIGELFKDRVGPFSKLVEEWCPGETQRFVVTLGRIKRGFCGETLRFFLQKHSWGGTRKIMKHIIYIIYVKGDAVLLSSPF